MKLKIELTEEQLSLLIEALEVNFRMMLNQPSIVADLLCECPAKPKDCDEQKWREQFERYLQRRDDANHILNALCNVLYGESWKKVPIKTHRLSDMWSALRHLQWSLQENRSEWDVRAWSPIQMSDYPMINVEVEE